MRILQPSAAQLASAGALSVPAETGLSASEIGAEIEAGRIRPEWSVLAIDESDEVIGRAMWWGRDKSVSQHQGRRAELQTPWPLVRADGR